MSFFISVSVLIEKQIKATEIRRDVASNRVDLLQDAEELERTTHGEDSCRWERINCLVERAILQMNGLEWRIDHLSKSLSLLEDIETSIDDGRRNC